MYLIYVSTDQEAIGSLESMLQQVDERRSLLAVANGYDLIHFLQNVRTGESYPDLILFNKQMARLNGHELLELLKTDDIYRLIPVIMFAPEATPEEEKFCQRLGAELLVAPQKDAEWLSAARHICEAVS